LGSNEKTIPELIDELENWDDATREVAARRLGELEVEEAVDPLMKALLTDKAEDVRAAAAEALGRFIGNAQVARQLADQLSKEDSPIVRAAIATAIGRIENYAAAKKIIPQLEREEASWVKEAIIEALEQYKGEEITAALLKQLQVEQPEEVRVQAAKSLGKTASKGILDEVLELFQKETSDEVRSYLTEVIAENPDIKSVDILVNALEDQEFKLTRAAAAEALYKIARKLGYKDENELIDSL